MKKLIKTIIVLLLVFTSGVYAGILYNAKDIEFSSEHTSKTNVEDAINELYVKQDELKDGKYVNFTQDGTYIDSYTTSTTPVLAGSRSLNKGTYLIVFSGSSAEYIMNGEVEGCSTLNKIADSNKFYYIGNNKIDVTDYQSGRGSLTQTIYKCVLNNDGTINIKHSITNSYFKGRSMTQIIKVN